MKLNYATQDNAAQNNRPQNDRPARSGKPASGASKAPTLGRLTQLGLKEPWQTALLLPKGWDDFRAALTDFRPTDRVQEGQYILVHGKLAGSPEVRFQGTPRLVGYLADKNGWRLGFSQFGDTKALQESLKPNPEDIYLYGQVRFFNNSYWLQNIERIPRQWVGRLRPKYPGKTKVINPETVRDRVFSFLKGSVPHAAKWLAGELASFGPAERLSLLAGTPDWSIEDIITKAHLPQTPELGRQAQEALETLAGMGVIQKAWKATRVVGQIKPLSLGDWERRSSTLPFPLTDEQEKAVREIIADLGKPRPMHRLLVGDVGTGKTAVYALPCAACVDGGGTVMVLLPNMPLASQVAKDFKLWWPDMKVQLVTGETTEIDPDCRLLVGTTAILFRNFEKPSLLVVDEQQKFSREQREQLVGSGTHLLEVSATCIPRSQALVRYGVVTVSKLTMCHVKKKIHTKIWTADMKGALFNEVKHTLSQGKQVLVVYPKRERGENESDDDPMHSVEEAYKSWNKLFPGRVRYTHGGLSDADKEQALKDMLEEKADILVATTVVEVGINLPKLYREMIVHPDRLGLSTLHQLRGRVARAGGAGWCDLFLPKPVKDETLARLKVLAGTEDGFKIAEQDMALRGMGDLSQESDKQTGADDTFLFGRSVRMEILDGLLWKMDQKRKEAAENSTR